MDHVIEHANNQKEARMTNEVRMWKKSALLFEMIGSNGRSPLSNFCNNREVSQCKSINWSDVKRSLLTKTKFKI